MISGRQETLKKLTESPLDVLVIGGGIVGSGVARDAAMRGLKTGLVERADFASGTSSRSSRLLHGGLRYLAQGRVGLVHEASVEKKVIHHIAPHLADPLPFLFPTYRTNKNWRLWQLRIGVKIYDLLCGGRNLGQSAWLKTTAVQERLPELKADGLTGAVRYFDGLTNDARLVLDTLRSAAKAGAPVLNYATFRNARRDSLWDCEIEDGVTGSIHKIQTRAVVNATGPWADGLPHSAVKLRLTKGIHLVVDRRRVPVPDSVVMTEGKRILFAIPWGERTVLGTTDTDYRGSLDDIRADAGDISYVLRIANEFFPGSKLRDSDVISTWAGVRPLLASASGKPSDISRSHKISSPEPDWWDVAGGKLTTYRLMAEQTVDRLAKALHLPAVPCRTASEPLLTTEETEGLSGILPPPFDRRTVEHACTAEWALHLDDLMLRRTSWHYYHHAGERLAETAAGWMAEILGWSPETRAAELRRYQNLTAKAQS
ncbi:MAG: glycerol-3-phosphate dehydrogenase/oxidase [Verrucomicrobiota bacterium]